MKSEDTRNHLKYNRGKITSHYSKLRFRQVIPSNERFEVCGNLKRFSECHDIFDMYDTLRQRTLSIFLRGELLQ
jgi:hypothetical protein